MKIASFCLLIYALIWAGAASALPLAREAGDARPLRSVSYSFWTISGSTVRLRYVLPQAERRHLVRAGAALPTAADISSEVGARLQVHAGQANCEEIDQGEGVGQVYIMALEPDVDRFEMVFHCPVAGPFVLTDSLLFDSVPGHVDYASVGTTSTPPVLGMFTRQSQQLAVSSSGKPLQHVGFMAFLKQTLRSIPGATMAFGILAGLLLLVRGRRDGLYLATGLLGGYALSLGMAASMRFYPSTALVEAGMAALLLLLGMVLPAARSFARRGVLLAVFAFCSIAALAANLRFGTSLALMVGGLGLCVGAVLWGAGGDVRARWLAFGFAVAFGVLDGLSPALDLQPLHLSLARILPVMSGYDAARIITAIVVAALMVLAWLASRRLPALGRLAKDFSCAGLVGLGVFLYAVRLYR